MKSYKIILSGGGTGGHIYPAIAIANELKLRFPMTDFLFVGASDKTVSYTHLTLPTMVQV